MSSPPSSVVSTGDVSSTIHSHALTCFEYLVTTVPNLEKYHYYLLNFLTLALTFTFLFPLTLLFISRYSTLSRITQLCKYLLLVDWLFVAINLISLFFTTFSSFQSYLTAVNAEVFASLPVFPFRNITSPVEQLCFFTAEISLVTFLTSQTCITFIVAKLPDIITADNNATAEQAAVSEPDADANASEETPKPKRRVKSPSSLSSVAFLLIFISLAIISGIVISILKESVVDSQSVELFRPRQDFSCNFWDKTQPRLFPYYVSLNTLSILLIIVGSWRAKQNYTQIQDVDAQSFSLFGGAVLFVSSHYLFALPETILNVLQKVYPALYLSPHLYHLANWFTLLLPLFRVYIIHLMMRIDSVNLTKGKTE